MTKRDWLFGVAGVAVGVILLALLGSRLVMLPSHKHTVFMHDRLTGDIWHCNPRACREVEFGEKQVRATSGAPSVMDWDMTGFTEISN